jgi:hypothetical protein
MWRGTCALIAGVVVACGGCGGGDDSDRPPQRVAEARVSSGDLGSAWPLSVSTGLLRCESRGALTFRVTGRGEYALTAAAAGRGLPPVEPLLKKDAHGDFMDMTALIDRGLRLCRPGQGTLAAAQREARRRAAALRRGQSPDSRW